MSSSVLQELTTVLQSVIYNNNCLVAAFAVYLFDRCVGISQEVDYIWLQRYTTVSALYVLLQAATVAQFILAWYQDLINLDCNRAYPALISLLTVECIYDVIIAIISALRVYAINPGNLVAPIAVFALLLVRVAYEIVLGATSQAIPVPPPLGCVIGSFSSSIDPLFIAAMAASTVADAIVLFVTWRKTYYTVRLARQENIAIGLTSLILRDGTIYFGLLATMNILSIVFYATNSFAGFNYFGTAFTSIILSRFFLNLREASLVTVGASGLSEQTSRSQSALQFSRGVGALGASLSFIGDDDNIDWDARDGDGDGDELTQTAQGGEDDNVETEIAEVSRDSLLRPSLDVRS